MVVTYHAKKRFLQRVIGTDNDDKRSIDLAARILEDNSSHIDMDLSIDLPIVGFKGAYIRVRNNTVVTVVIKEKK
ncbi:MAG: hypothetical protein DRJ64_04500 [Thermoprotei archaeon]|nr:MAG: hypothetical protein DRJ64_04500 [Thermoprotei archaeon]